MNKSNVLEKSKNNIYNKQIHSLNQKENYEFHEIFTNSKKISRKQKRTWYEKEYFLNQSNFFGIKKCLEMNND